MKNILFSFLILLLLSCNQNTQSKDRELFISTNKISFTDNKEILGNWTMCSSFGNGMMEQYNVCPKVSFLANGSGYVGSLLLSTDRFSWTFEKGKLNIYGVSKFSNATFPDTFYFASIRTDNNFKSLVISATKKDSEFFLSR